MRKPAISILALALILGVYVSARAFITSAAYALRIETLARASEAIGKTLATVPFPDAANDLVRNAPALKGVAYIHIAAGAETLFAFAPSVDGVDREAIARMAETGNEYFVVNGYMGSARVFEAKTVVTAVTRSKALGIVKEILLVVFAIALMGIFGALLFRESETPLIAVKKKRTKE